MRISFVLFMLVSQTPMVVCRLTGQPKESVEQNLQGENTLTDLDLMSFMGHEIMDLTESQPNDMPIVHRNLTVDSANTPEQDNGQRRELGVGSMEVVIQNSCSSQIFVSLSHTTDWGSVLTTSDIPIKSGESHSFDGVVGNSFSMFGYTGDHGQTWEGAIDENDVDCRPDGRCYKVYTVDGSPSRYTKYLSCSSASAETRASKFSQQQAKTISSNAWVRQHNKKRKAYYKKVGLSNKQVAWSDSLAKGAQDWANHLAKESKKRGYCHLEHAGPGENLASNAGRLGNTGPRAGSVMKRWVDDEEGKKFPQNLHWSQALWRGTKYIGCGQASVDIDGSYSCHIQCCRYIAPGNCNVNSANLESKMLEDASPCGSQTPPK